MENSVTLYGASGHGKVIIDILRRNSIVINAVLDDNPRFETILNIPVVKTTNVTVSQINTLILSVGNNKTRKKISKSLSNVKYITAIHPSAIVSNHSKIESGTVIMAGVIINPDVTIGQHCIINSGAIIEHDCIVEDFAHISPGVSLAGNVTIGEGSHIGIGACIIQGIKVGRWVTVGAGAVVLNDIPDYATAVGNPARVIKLMNENE